MYVCALQEAEDAVNVTTLRGTTTELPEDEKLTFFAPWDFGWSAELLDSSDPVQVCHFWFSGSSARPSLCGRDRFWCQ